jgi:3-isopropylmalate/(R)-2-methylmalate dehydratase small subunit
MAALTHIRSAAVVLPQQNIDTDQIIPARFLSTTTRAGLGQHAFSDWRAQADFPFNQARNAGRQILIAGRNFGCGSSREHAPWALTDLGLKAVISSQIADIFRNNALKNGLLPIVLDEAIVQHLMQQADGEFAVDVAACTLTTPQGQVHQFPLDAFARTCLLEGVDELGYLLKQAPAINEFETARRHDFSISPREETAHAR